MRILRGALLTVGIALLFLASCAEQWEPVPILLLGLSGAGLCLVAKAVPEKRKSRRTWGNTNRRQAIKDIPYIMGQKRRIVKMDIDEFIMLPEAPQEPTPCPVCGSEDCTDEVCPLWAGWD